MRATSRQRFFFSLLLAAIFVACADQTPDGPAPGSGLGAADGFGESAAPVLELRAGRGTVTIGETVVFEGSLVPDGTAGMSYFLRPEEGWVCGDLYLSKWDPENEGYSLQNAITVRWMAPDGSVRRECAPSMARLEGIYDGESDSFEGTFVMREGSVSDPPDRSGYQLRLSGGQGVLSLDGVALFEGSLVADGTAGMSYFLRPEEGWVCGDLYLSKWDPENEGYSLENAITVRWMAPDGSVRRECAPDLVPVEGIYEGDSDTFQGTFVRTRDLPASSPAAASQQLVLEGGHGVLSADGVAVFEGSLVADGTAGMSYFLRPEEGWVCGDLYLSKWDPENEGYSLQNAIAVRWMAPDGSVRSTCAPDLVPVEGIYEGDSDIFEGTFVRTRDLP